MPRPTPPKMPTSNARNPRSRRYMKKTTKSGAYKKPQKKQMMIRRAPVVELKTRNHAEVEELNGYEINDNPCDG